MKLSNLLKNVDVIEIKNFCDLDIKCLSMDSRNESPNGIFFCISGESFDGHNYFLQATSNGAVCLVVDHFVDSFVTQILVKNIRNAMSQISANFFEFDKCNIKFVGITGTNGKTTTSFLVKNILSNLNHTVGLIGTEGCFVNSEMITPPNLTTPDSTDLFQTINIMMSKNVEYIIMEVSAHALFYDKIDLIKFEVSALTNITQDHLDFFGNMLNYINAKKTLFQDNHSKKCIINIDEANSHEVFNQIHIPKFCLSKDKLADYIITNIKSDINGNSAILTHQSQNHYLFTSMIGEYNLYNCVMAVAICHQMGFDIQTLCDVLAENNFVVPGRFNTLKTKICNIIIDFAHTPDGMEKILKTINDIKTSNQKLVVVFGCGGNRDKIKRPLMGEIASRLADYVVITSDNPRYENPDDIISDVEKGIKTNNYVKISDRKEAIHFALNSVQKNDIVAILGKGNEQYQVIDNIKQKYNDFDVINTYMENFDD
ncbi:MAG: UDP-N-acetylmuramoyl-L-alanyl-D-glutamate--2,6-diaminopimelate ligase [Clostridia bacterium]|nr:UDP-N-acetylmuramoyl-L-alanyl-D-glutamate--2,6-diaminopimelate ligase [Clostridia bacterium]